MTVAPRLESPPCAPDAPFASPETLTSLSQQTPFYEAPYVVLVAVLDHLASLASNIQWHWTPNGYLASLLAGIAAFLATAACLSIGELITRL